MTFTFSLSCSSSQAVRTPSSAMGFCSSKRKKKKTRKRLAPLFWAPFSSRLVFETIKGRDKKKVVLSLLPRHAAASPATAALRHRRYRRDAAADALAGAAAGESAAGSRGIMVDRGIARNIVVAHIFRGRGCGSRSPARQARLHSLQDAVSGAPERWVNETEKNKKKKKTKRRKRESERETEQRRDRSCFVLSPSQAASLTAPGLPPPPPPSPSLSLPLKN